MDTQKEANVKNRLKMQISSLSIDREDLYNLLKKLQERSNAATNLEIKIFKETNTEANPEKNC